MQYEQENQRKECKLKVLRTEQRGVFVFLGKEIILSKIKVLKRSDRSGNNAQVRAIIRNLTNRKPCLYIKHTNT